MRSAEEHGLRLSGVAIAVAVSAATFMLHADSPRKKNERPDVQMRLTRLLLPLYLPSGKPAQQEAHAAAFIALATSGSAAASSPSLVVSSAAASASSARSGPMACSARLRRMARADPPLRRLLRARDRAKAASST